MQEKLEMQQRLQIQNEIKKIEGKLITKAMELIDSKQPFQSMEENQIRNVLDVALMTDCVEVIDVYIKYQIGRSKPNEKWRFGNFGDSLIIQIKELKEKAKEIADFSEIKTAIEPIWLQLTRLYLGHLNHYFYYRKKERE
jgi:hypothetical protein